MKKLATFLVALCATTALWAAFTPAAFTVSADGKQVYFSQGNLQCSGVTSGEYVWSFAENQYDMLGTANVTGGTESYNTTYGYSKSGDALADKIDLFGWSGSTGTAPWGISTSQNSDDYAGDFVDWGTNIGNGTTYRTLTKDEWYYLLNTRTNADNLIGVARINLNSDGTEYANGLILLPDDWTAPADVAFKSGFSSEYSIQAYADYQTFTLDQWQKLEAAGAVFLPASGCRFGSDMRYVRYYGGYWSATPIDSDYAGSLDFISDYAYTYYDSYRYYGQAVRLVQDLYAVTLTTPEHGIDTADKTYAAAGETITLTITPDTGYELDVLEVKDASEGTVTVSSDHKFTMPASNVTVTATFKAVTPTALQTAELMGIYAENGRIYGIDGMQIFTLTGQNVTEMNGSLNGVYIVKVGDKAQKVIVSSK